MPAVEENPVESGHLLPRPSLPPLGFCRHVVQLTARQGNEDSVLSSTRALPELTPAARLASEGSLITELLAKVVLTVSSFPCRK